MSSFSCTQCDKQFDSNGKLTVHEKRTHDLREFSCEECGKKFRSNSHLKIHKAHKHSEKRPYACENCPNAFKSLPSLRTHIKRVHKKHMYKVNNFNKMCEKSISKSPETETMVFCCGKCPLKFSSKGELISHRIIAKHGKIVSCTDCGKKFSKRYIKQHRAQIHGI